MDFNKIYIYGNHHDGAIEVPFSVDKGYIETGYFFGDDKLKDIIAISTQVGCPSGCRFCELGEMPFIRNLEAFEFREQVDKMLKIVDRYAIQKKTNKISLSKSGEPLRNPNIIEGMRSLSDRGYSFKFSTIIPKGTIGRLAKVAEYSADIEENVQLQISLISTDEIYRRYMIGINTEPFEAIANATDHWYKKNPERKVNLSLILNEDTPADPRDVLSYFPPERYRVRFRPAVETLNSKKNGLKMISEERLKKIVEEFASYGYDKGYWATPTQMERYNGLASNVTLRRYLNSQ